MESTEKNLCDFYRFIGKAESVHYFDEDGYSVVYSDTDNWPQILFAPDKKINPEHLIPKISKDITDKKYPPFFISPFDYINKSHAPLLKEYNFVPITLWKGMQRKAVSQAPLKIPDDTDIRKLNQQKEYEDFTNLVNEDLMATQLINKSILESIASEKDIQLYGLYYHGTLASSFIIYYSGGVAGLYFLATKIEFRNKGYGTFMMQNLLNEINLNGVEEVILHTNGNAMKLYEKAGFQTTTEFIIYRKF